MVDLRMTCKGYFELESDAREQARICWLYNPPVGSVAYEEGAKYMALADSYRAKAYDLMGVVTINPKQLSFLGELK